MTLLVLLLILGTQTAWAQTAAQQLEAARIHASQDSHVDAIDAYRAAFDADSTLVDSHAHELAHQYAWAGRPHEAITWYERRLETAPDHIEARLGLARVLSWTDRLAEAQREYEVVLDSNPENLEARRGQARMDAWQDDLDEALRKYERLLQEYPEDREVRLEHAQVVNWSGAHADAVVLYQGILSDHGDDREAMRGLIEALRWGGREREALELLGPMWANSTSVPLWYELTRATGPVLEFSSGVSEDSDDLRVHSSALTWEGYLGGDLRTSDTRTRVGLRHVKLDQDGQPDIEGIGGSVGGAKHLNLRTTLNLHAWLLHFGSDGPVVGTGDPSDLRYTLFGYDGWLTWQPNARLRFDLSSDRNFVDTPRSLGHETAVTHFGLSMDARLAPRVFFSALLREGFYSDGNERLLGQVSVTRAFGRPWVLRVAPRAMAFSFSEQKNHGYWNPDHFTSIGLNASLGLERANARLRPHVEATTAREWESGEGYGIFALSGGVAITLNRDWELDLRAGTSNSRLSGSAGYERDWGRLVLRVRY